MGDMCGDNRLEIINKAKEDILSSTNIKSDKKELEVLDRFLFRCWQMGWLKCYDDRYKDAYAHFIHEADIIDKVYYLTDRLAYEERCNIIERENSNKILKDLYKDNSENKEKHYE